MNNENLTNFLDLWKEERFPHKNIKNIASNHINSNIETVNLIIYERILEDKDIYLDFAGTFFWEFWKHHKPDSNILTLFLFHITNKDISDITRYSISLALTSCYKNHDIYKKNIFNKLKDLLEDEQVEFSETMVDQIYEAIY